MMFLKVLNKMEIPTVDEKRTTCVAHPQYEGMIQDLRETAKSLVDGQMELKMTMIQLTENLKGLERLENRVDRLEDKHNMDEAFQGTQIDELRKFMYKAVGAIAVVTCVLPIAIKLGMVMFL